MTPVNDHLSLLSRALTDMQGLVIPDYELPTALWLIDTLRTPISPDNINSHLERNAQALGIAGYFYNTAHRLLKEANSSLDEAFSNLYNSLRSAALQGRHPKAPSQATLENAVKVNPKYTEHRAMVTRLEFCRDTLKDLRDCISSRSRHLEQISNNYRFDRRFDDA